jgi:hypothetical protein
VVAIKFTDIDDVFLSLQTGVWVTHPNVMSRVMDVHDSHENESMKTLLLFSMPGRFVDFFLFLFNLTDKPQQVLLRPC